MYINGLCAYFAQDKRLLAILINPFVRIMWRKHNKGRILFAPYALFKGWSLEKESQVSLCILLGLLSYPWVSISIYLVSLLSSSYFYFAATFWTQIITYKIICGIIMRYYEIKAVSGGYLNSLDEDEFRRYLKAFVLKNDSRK